MKKMLMMLFLYLLKLLKELGIKKFKINEVSNAVHRIKMHYLLLVMMNN